MLRPFFTGLAEFLYPTTPRAQFALRTAFALVLAAFAALALHLANPFWATMSAAMIMNPSIGATLERGLMRIIGTVVGALVGLLLASISANSFYLFMSFGFIILSLGAYFSLTTKYPFAFIFGTISAFLVMSSMVYDPSNPYYFMIYRIQEIGVGVIAGLIASLLIFPTQAKDQLQQKLAVLAELLADLNEQLTALYYQKTKDTSVNKNRIQEIRKNLLSCNELFQASKLEFSNAGLDLSLARALWEAQRSLFKQLEALSLNYRADLAYTLLDHTALNLKPLFTEVTLELKTLALFLKTGTNPPPLMQRATELYAQFDAQLATFREDRKTLLYPAAESATLYALSQNLGQITAVLAKISQLCQEATSLQKYAPDRIKTPFFVFDRSKETIQYSIKAGLSIVLATLLWMGSDWPAGIQGIISAAIISFQKNIYDIQLRGELRFLGAAIGGVVGLLVLHFFALKVDGLLLILWIFGWIFAYFTFGNGKYSYAALQANVALCITLLHSPIQVITIAPALQRLAGVFIGILATVLIYRLVWPTHPRELLNKGIYEQGLRVGAFFRHLLATPPSTMKLIDQDYAHINAKFLRNNELLESLRTYLHREDPFLAHAEQLIEIERNCATLIFIMIKGTDLTIAHHIALTYQVDLTDLLNQIADLFNFDLIGELNFVHSLQISKTEALLVRITETISRLAHGKSDAAHFLYLLNNLLQLLEIYTGFAATGNILKLQTKPHQNKASSKIQRINI